MTLTPGPSPPLVLEPWELEQALKRINPNQAPATDQLGRYRLRAYHRQPSGVFCEVFHPSRGELSLCAQCINKKKTPVTMTTALEC